MSKNIAFENSFALHPKSMYWSDRNEVKSESCSLNSHKKYWFNCDKCSHEFESTLLNINQSNNWCPYCYNRKLCNLSECNTCFNKSFASHPKSVYWSELNICKPIEVIKGSEKKFHFNCDKCHHKLLISLKHISTRDQWCPYCSHQQLCKEDNCNMCLQNSFASVENSKYLFDKNINPRTLFKSTNKKHKFECNKCFNTFETQLSDITKGVWCPNCYNKTEEKLYNQFKNLYIIKRQFKPLWCKNPETNKYLPFDFVIEELKIIIEQDGPQHFKQIGKWQSPELTLKNDIYKMNCANVNGYSIIRILQKDIWYNKYDWFQELCHNIEKIKNDGIIQNIYMCKNNEYKNFDENLEIPKLCC
jgi:very-short-patch-repair endonuclease